MLLTKYTSWSGSWSTDSGCLRPVVNATRCARGGGAGGGTARITRSSATGVTAPRASAVTGALSRAGGVTGSSSKTSGGRGAHAVSAITTAMVAVLRTAVLQVWSRIVISSAAVRHAVDHAIRIVRDEKRSIATDGDPRQPPVVSFAILRKK